MGIKQSNYATATHAAATATIPASGNQVINGLQCFFSYSAAPTGGKVDIKDGTTVIGSADITAGGQGVIDLNGLVASNGAAMSAVLADGGAGIVGKVTLTGYYR